MQNRLLSKVLRASIVALILALLTLAAAEADGRFSGTVLDQSGAFVPGAAVTVKNERTGEVRTAVSAGDGRYLVINLTPSVYTISGMFGSFQPIEFTDMTLAAGQEFPLDLELHARWASNGTVRLGVYRLLF
jgi:hypothetical protein